MSAALACLLLLTPLTKLTSAALAVLLAALLNLAQSRKLPWHRLAHLEGVVVLLLITLPLTTAGQPLATLGPLTASAEGVERAALLALKLTAATLLLANLRPEDLAHLPLPRPLARILALQLRYLGLIGAELTRLRAAMRARSFTPRSAWHTWQSLGWALARLLQRCLHRAQTINEAMALRAPNGPARFLTPARAPTPRALSAASCAAFLALLLWDRL